MTNLAPELVEPTPRRIRVRLNDRLVADSSQALLLIRYGPTGLPTYFLPRDDVVADAYAAVLQAMRNGTGPRENFRAYLLACVRNGATLRRSRPSCGSPWSKQRGVRRVRA